MCLAAYGRALAYSFDGYTTLKVYNAGVNRATFSVRQLCNIVSN